MICIDCSKDKRLVVCEFSPAHLADICLECGRMYVPGADPHHLQYVDEKSCKAKIRHDQAEKKHRSVSTAALVDRILHPEKYD